MNTIKNKQVLIKKTILIAIAAFLTVNVWGQTLNIPNGASGIGTSATGNIGIGTNDPSKLLHIKKNVSGGVGASIFLENNQYSGNAGAETEIIFGHYSDSQNPRRYAKIHSVGVSTIGTPDRLSFGLTNGDTYNDILHLKYNGNVGIGTTTPDNKLHVFVGESGGSSYSNSTLTLENNTSNFLQFLTPNTNVQGIMFGDPEHAYAGYIRYNHIDNSMRLYTSNTQRLAIIDNGNVGIGTSSPVGKLDINNSTLYNSEYSFTGQDHIVLSAPDPGDNGYFGGITWQSGGRRRASIVATRERVDADYVGIAFFTRGTDGPGPIYESMRITRNGNVLIGTTTDYGYKLAVDGKVICEEVKVEMSDQWADFVFEPTYNLMPLKELDNYIQENKHLPEIPTTAEVQENGISVGEMNAKLLQKIEELTLYMIEKDNEVNELRNELEEMKEKLLNE